MFELLEIKSNHRSEYTTDSERYSRKTVHDVNNIDSSCSVHVYTIRILYSIVFILQPFFFFFLFLFENQWLQIASNLS